MSQNDNVKFKGYGAVTLIGGGGFSEVYSATQSSIGREVVIKVIRPDRASQPDFIRRFETEAQIVARLEHPHITPLIDYWRDPQGAYLVMRYLRGGSIYDTIKQRGAVDPSTTSRMLEQIASALDFAHRNDAIHRDIKPGNLLLDEDGNAYVADFGIAKDLTVVDPDSQTNPEHIIGSLDYIAPEQARGEPVTPRTDIYSLGVTLYEMLTGKHPFENENPIQRLYKHMTDPLPDLEGLPDDVQDVLNDIIQKATAKDPAKRYPDVIALAVAFREAVKARPVEGLTPREIDILLLLAERKTNHEIAQSLFLSYETVRWHLGNIYKKIGAPNRSQAVKRARELGWLGGDEIGEQPAALTGEFSLIEPDNPYKGLHSFNIEDARDFFGREKAVEKLLQRMTEGSRFERFLALVGPSGSGKSSLVKAGLHPALRNGSLPGSDKWFYVSMKPQNHPLDELEIALTKLAANQGQNMRQHLERDERGLVRAAELLLPDDGSELFIIIDQFEEVFTLVENEQERQHFLKLLLSAASDVRSRVRLVVTLRADYYDKPLHYPEFGEMLRTRMETILPLTATGLEQAISRPAQRVGVNFEPGLVAQIVSEINYQAGALPLLQYALTELFEYRQGRLLTLEAYQRIGGVVGALAKGADTIYNGFDSAAQQLTKQIFLRLVTLGEGAEDTRRRVTLDELMSITQTDTMYRVPTKHGATVGTGYIPSAEDEARVENDLLNEILESFTQSRLLTLGHDDGTRQPTVEVAHEAILREWATLREWLNDSRDDIRQERELAHQANHWQAHKRDVSYLLRGTQLTQVENWRTNSSLALTPLENDFIAGSIQQRKHETDLEISRIAEKATQEKRSQNLLRALVAVLLLATLGAFGLTGITVNQSKLTQQALATSDASLLAAREQALLNAIQSSVARNDLDAARALSLAATNGDNPALASQVLLSQAAYAPGTVRVYRDDQYNQFWFRAALSPDERYLVMTDTTHLFPIVWDLTSGAVINVFPEIHTARISNIAFRPTPADQPWQMLTVSDDGTIILWDFEQRQPIRILETLAGGVSNVAFSPDGESILFASGDGTLKLRDTDNDNLLRNFEGHTDWIISGKFSPDGTTILSASADRTAILWDTETGAMIKQFPIGIFPTGGAVFSPDGTQFAVGSFSDFVLTLWDIETAQEIRRFSRIGPIGRAVFSQDGQTIFANEGDFITFWNIETSAVINSLSAQSHLTGFVVNAQESQLISWSGNGTIRQWDLRHGAEIAHSSFPHLGDDGDISPDGQIFVVASGGNSLSFDPGIVVLFDAVTGAEIRRFGEDGIAHTINTGNVRFSPDGQTILSSAWDGEIKLWNANDGTLLQTYEGVTSGIDGNGILADINSIDFAPDGTAFIAATDEGEVVVGDVLTGEATRRFAFDAPVKKAIFNADGRQFLACLADDEFSIVLVDFNSGQTLLRLIGQSQMCLALAFAPDGITAISGDYNGNNYLWDLTTGQLVRQFIGVQGRITEIAFSPDGQTVFAGSFSRSANTPLTLVRWDVATGEPIRYFMGHNRPVDGLDLSADGRTLLSVAYDGTARLWRVDSLDELITWTRTNRYIPELSCEQRQLYHIEPLCDGE